VGTFDITFGGKVYPARIRDATHEEVTAFFARAKKFYNKREKDLRAAGEEKERAARTVKKDFAEAMPRYLDGLGTQLLGLDYQDGGYLLGLIAIRHDGRFENGESALAIDFVARLPELLLDDPACKPGGPMIEFVKKQADNEEHQGRVVIPEAFGILENYYRGYGFKRIKDGPGPNTLHMEYLPGALESEA